VSKTNAKTNANPLYHTMKDKEIIPGKVVISTCGHDEGRIYVVVKEIDCFVEVCDGHIRSLDHPKRKRRTHVRPVGEIPDALTWLMSMNALPKGVQNSEIRKAIKAELARHTRIVTERKGEIE
jgi:ribosomal protein L14E/L6E/L27E